MLVVYNTAWTADSDTNGVQDSKQIADYYVAFRGIPTNQVLGVSTRVEYNYDAHGRFYDQLVAPIKAQLSLLGPSNIDVIVLVHGIPYSTPRSSGGSLCVDNCLMSLNHVTTNNNMAGWLPNPYAESTPTFSTDKGHFDHGTYKYSGQNVYIVCRLNAPDPPWGVINQLEQIRYAEKYVSTGGLMGCAYVDSRFGPYTDSGLATNPAVVSGSYYAYVDGDMNMAFAERYVLAKGIPLRWENAGTDKEIGEAGSAFLIATNALLYGGWYNYGRYIDAFEWLPGSVGCDLNSDSASGMRDGRVWVGGAFRQGLSCAAGVIGEPYMNGHQRPNVLIYYLLQGYTFAEASMLSTPYMEWQCSNLGDPLYAPFRPKPAATDTSVPILSTGFPRMLSVGQTNASIVFGIEYTNIEPEAVRCVVSYGLTPDCTQTSTARRGYWVRKDAYLTGLHSGTTYYYRLMLADPAGNFTNTGVFTFQTSNAPPRAICTVDAATGTAPFLVTFDGGGSSDADGYVTNWVWDFGDGQTGVGSSIPHVYTNPGLVVAKLTVMDDDGASSSTTMLLRVNPSVGTMVLLQQGVEGYTNTMDTYITRYGAGNSNRNFGAADQAQTYSGQRRGLVWFDVSRIPAGACVEKAELRLYTHQKNYGTSSDFWAAYGMTQSWVEGTGSVSGVTNGSGATWMDSDRGYAWTKPGGDFNTSVVAQVNYTSITVEGWAAFDVRSLVTAWIAGTSSNRGIMVKPRDDDCLVDFRTREWTVPGQRPMLLVIYTNPIAHILWANAGPHGTLWPTGAVLVAAGSNAEFSLSADSYYHIGRIVTNGADCAGSPFTDRSFTNAVFVWSNVTAQGTFDVFYAANEVAHQVPEWWLAQFGWTNDFDAAAEDDPDDDGMTTWQEYLAGTVPTSRSSVFKMSFAGSSGLVLQWLAATDRVYTVEFSTNLDPAGFSVLGTASNLPAAQDMNIFTNMVVTNSDQIFYRLKVRRQESGR
ncbi:MAG: TIGR03790 family protein [bacterium]